MMRLTVARAFLASTLFAACTDGGPTGPDTEPTLEVTSPERGTTTDGTSVTVAGRTTGSNLTVTINGQTVTTNADGSFSASIDVPAGMTVLETHAIDKSGHDLRDVRAVLAGAQAQTDGSQTAQIAARAGRTALTAVGNLMAQQAEGIDFTAIAKQANPVYNNGGCLGAVVNITSVDLSNISAAIDPQSTLGTDVVLDNVVVKAHADYKAACIGGSTTITIKSSHARIHGDLAVNVVGSTVKTSLTSPTVNLEGFQLDVGGLPGAVEDLVKDKVKTAVQDALVTAIQQKVPAFADQALQGLVAKPVAANLLGHQMAFGISPSDVQISSDGLYVALDASVTVEGGDAGVYVPTSAQASPALLADSGDLGVALANDAVNQLFGALWATNSLDQELDISTVGPLAALLDDDTKTLSVHLALPPQVTTVGTELGLAIGDLIITGKDAAGNDVQKLALTITTTLSATPTQSGAIALATGNPVVKAQVVSQSAVVERPLTSQQLEGIVSGAWGLVGGFADDALAKIPLPVLGGMAIQAPRVGGKDGFVVAQIAVQ